MKLLLVLLALGARRWVPAELAHLPGRWTRQWRDTWLGRQAAAPWMVLLLVVLPPLLLLLGLLWLLDGVWYNAPYFLLSLFVLVAILLDKQAPDVQTRLREDWLQRAWPNAAEPDLLPVASTLGLELENGRRLLVKEQLGELFSPLFWFLLLGPLALLAYHLLRILAEVAALQAGGRLAAEYLAWADWLPARVLALTLALAGRFQETWQYLQGKMLDLRMPPLELADGAAACAHASSLELDGESAPGAVLILGLADIAALLQRALVVWIVLLALKTLWP